MIRSQQKHAKSALDNLPRNLTPLEILRKIKARHASFDHPAADHNGAASRAQPQPRRHPHPKKAVATSLKRFIKLREERIEKQAGELDLLGRADEARQLARRLTDPAQVPLYIAELNEQADDFENGYQARLKGCQAFWYGPNGLEWLASKKNMQSRDWLAYAEFMDEAALKALAALIERDLLRRYAKSIT
ncbi:hypothetical protein J2W39_005823 [Variovorax paradoxus]|uniref:Uncharacterized protein n=1 Tax=Variovorax paradoxus TaxID=34073 RepID=A0AAW8EQQ2_VARPD|nr:hypothetical protein [Variovorax paradoxus]MDP9974554.1 hypothetical protein [Variovorax paradoxus]